MDPIETEKEELKEVNEKTENLDVTENPEDDTAIYQEENLADDDNEKKSSKNIDLEIPTNDDDEKKSKKHGKSRSRSRSEEFDKKKKQKRKKKGKKNRRTYENKLTDPKVIELTKKAIDNDPNIPANLKDKFKRIETNLLTLCIQFLSHN